MQCRSIIVASGLSACLICAKAVAATGPRTLLLDVWINGQPRNQVLEVQIDDKKLIAQRGELKEFGLRLGGDASEAVDIGRIEGLRYEVDNARQRLLLDVTQPLREPEVFVLRETVKSSRSSSAGVSPRKHTGAVDLEYDVVVRTSDFDSFSNSFSGGGSFRLSATNGMATFESSAYAITGRDQSRAVRLDTRVVIDQPTWLRSWTFGDSISGGLTWSRSVRFAGVQVARDFTLRPGLSPLALPSFFGQAAVPSTVDVFLGASRVFQQKVDPGPFQLRNIPVLTGGDTATIVVRDALGRQQSFALPLYVSPRLLEPGLSSYSFEMGFLREGYGIESFSYNDPLGMATMRYGLTDQLTLSGHAEISNRVKNVGGAAAIGVQPFGVLELAAAGSRAERKSGGLLSASFETARRPLSLFGSYTYASRDYRDVASFDGFVPPREHLQVGMSVSMNKLGAVSGSWLDIRDADGRTSKIANASYTFSLGGRGSFAVSGLRDFENDRWAVAAYVAISFGPRGNVSLAMQRDDNRTRYQTAIARPANPDGGFGFRVATTTGNPMISDGEVEWRGEHTRLSALVAAVGSRVSAEVSASGRLIAMEGDVFMRQQTDGAYSLVDTGQENVRIYRENRLVAQSGPDGKALVTGLVPFSENAIAIEPRDYPISVVLDRASERVVPGRRTGGVVNLAPERREPVSAIVTLPDGTFPPPGTEVRIEASGAFTVVGRNGKLFIPDLKTALNANLFLSEGACRIVIPLPDTRPRDVIPQVGPLRCEWEAIDGHPTR